MNAANENPLNPVLGLSYRITENKAYVYYLEVGVKDRFINRTSETMEDDPAAATKNGMDLVVGYALRNEHINGENQSVHLQITSNPEGLPGGITVLISEPDIPKDIYSPQADGKSIIRFEKATRLR